MGLLYDFLFGNFSPYMESEHIVIDVDYVDLSDELTERPIGPEKQICQS